MLSLVLKLNLLLFYRNTSYEMLYYTESDSESLNKNQAHIYTALTGLISPQILPVNSGRQL
jgi:hypothetical protein